MRPEDCARTVTDLQPGSHLCCLYESEEELRAFAAPYLQEGVRRNEKVLYIADARSLLTILDYLHTEGIEPDPYLESGQLEFSAIDSSYLRDGVFEPSKATSFLEAATASALRDGCTALRVTIDMTWTLGGLPGAERLVEYESKLNQFFPWNKCLGLCLYDRRRFPPSVLLNVLMVHPVVTLGSRIYQNSFFNHPGTTGRFGEQERVLRHCLADLAAWNELRKGQGAWP